jgi:hypothetical protein
MAEYIKSQMQSRTFDAAASELLVAVVDAYGISSTCSTPAIGSASSAFVLAVAGDASGASADSAPAMAAVHSAATVAGCAATAGMALQLPPMPIRPPFRGSIRSAARASSQVPATAELQGQGPTLASSSRK